MKHAIGRIRNALGAQLKRLYEDRSGATAVFMAAGLVALACMELSNTWWYTVLQQHIPPQALSRVSSYDWLVSLVFQPIGFMLVGPIAESIGPSTTLIAAATFGVMTNLAVLAVPGIRRLRWRTDESPNALPVVPERPLAATLEVE